MKLLKLLSLSLLLVFSAGTFTVAAKTTRKSPARKTATTRKSAPKMSIKTVCSQMFKWSQENYSQSFNKKLAASRRFMNNTVNPYIAAKYPSMKSASDIQKCRTMYDDMEKHISNTPYFERSTASQSEGAVDLMTMNKVTAYLVISEIEGKMADEASKSAWLSYAAKLDEVLSKLNSVAFDYSCCSGGVGSLLAVTGPRTEDAICDGMIKMLTQDLYVLKGGDISVSSSLESAKATFYSAISYSNLDPELLEYVPESCVEGVRKTPAEINAMADDCNRLHRAWVLTLPPEVRPRMTNNLSELFVAATNSIEE